MRVPERLSTSFCRFATGEGKIPGPQDVDKPEERGHSAPSLPSGPAGRVHQYEKSMEGWLHAG